MLFDIDALPDKGTLTYRKTETGGRHIIVQLPGNTNTEGMGPYLSLWPEGRGRIGSAMHKIKHYTLRKDNRPGRGASIEFLLIDKSSE